MPVIKSAIKKLRKDRKREKVNDEFREGLDRAIRNAKKVKSSKAVSAAVSIIDRAVKNNLMHQNRAARIKSALSKLAKPAKAAERAKASVPKKVAAKKSTTAKSTPKKSAKK